MVQIVNQLLLLACPTNFCCNENYINVVKVAPVQTEVWLCKYSVAEPEPEPEPEPPEPYNFDPRRTGTGTVSLL
jgi:hypothetical protein